MSSPIDPGQAQLAPRRAYASEAELPIGAVSDGDDVRCLVGYTFPFSSTNGVADEPCMLGKFTSHDPELGVPVDLRFRCLP